jgi:gas vesicle protein
MTTEGGGYRGAHILAAFLIGAATGAVIAYLTAPESGGRGRERLKDAARTAGRAAREAPARVRDSLTRAVEAARSVLEDALGEGTRR